MENSWRMRMDRLIVRIVSSLAVLMFASCSLPYFYLNQPIEVYKPARVSLSSPGLNVGIIYRNPVVPEEISKYDPYFTHIEFAPSLYHINPVAYHHIETLKRMLNESVYFESAEYLTEEIPPPADSIRIMPVTPDESRRYFEQYPGMDVLFFLDYLAGTINTEYFRDLGFFQRLLLTNPVWQISERSTGRVFIYNRTDTVRWEGFAKSSKEINMHVPDQEQAFLEGAEFSAETFSQFLIPRWITVNRTLYRTLNDDMRLACKLTEQNRLEEAAAVYERLIGSEKMKIRAMAMFNMAFVSEMQDDLEGATNWLLKSYFVFKETKPEHARLTRDYLGIIAQRKKDLRLLESIQEEAVY